MAPGHIRVNIFGSEYTLMSDNDENFVKEIARYVDEKMREIDKNQNINSSTRVAVLAALNVAEELFQERLYRTKLSDQLNEEAKKINLKLQEVLEE
ncbi:MAG TPA: cell division protein ZapA [Caldithrix abyssi]|uniref:Cell division protein ZapA n=1 Tax=Caldithrix abyssi TaxID=187145 RepID=A0A7V5PNT3_CALAY|nr:cell division protein ZapA [Caldithrix abyssi]